MSNQPQVDPTASTDLFFLATTASESDDWVNALGLGQESFQSMDWGFNEHDPHLFDVFNTHAPNSPARDIFHPLNTRVEQSAQQPISTSHRSPEELHGPPSEIPDGQPFDSPWVNMFFLRSHEKKLKL